MTRKKKLDVQMNLPLCETPPIDGLPQARQRELAEALADLLWNAAVEHDPLRTQATGDQS